MKTLLAPLLFIFAATTFAQNAPPQSATVSGCGTDRTKFDVKSDKSQHPSAKPDPSKATIYFLQDDGYFLHRPRPTTRFGLDGNWIGATHANSYFYVFVDPGEHHVCANWQNYLGVRTSFKEADTRFTAEAGRVYFYVVNDLYLESLDTAGMKLNLLNSDQAQLLMNEFAFSTSRAKK